MRSTWTAGLLGGCALIVLAGQAAGLSSPRRSLAPTGRCIATTTPAPVTPRSHKSARRTSRASARSGRIGLAGVGRQRPNSQATPIVVDGVMYLPAANRVVALDPETGTERWQSRRRRRRAVSPRRRVLVGRSGSVAHHLHGRPPADRAGRGHGQPAVGFGTNGEVDIVVPYNSVPLVYRNVVRGWREQPAGVRRRARQCACLRRPHRREALGIQLGGAARQRRPRHLGGRQLEGALRRQCVAVLFHARRAARDCCICLSRRRFPGGYGGDRDGANLYGNSVVAVDVQTGAYKWHFQTIHHDLWDADPPAPPGLIDIVRNGRRVPAMALTTKSGYMYILNRETGQPIFGVEERPVPESDVPGERAFPTQPIPVKPPALARVAYRPGGSCDRERIRHRNMQPRAGN